MLYLGATLWLISVLSDFLFGLQMTNIDKKGIINFRRALSIKFSSEDQIGFGLSIAKLTGLFWIGVDLITNHLFHIDLSSWVVAIVLLAPLLIGAIIRERIIEKK